MRLAYAALLLVSGLAAPGCTIVWDDDDDIICPAEADDGNGFAAPLPGQVNPWSLECQYFGGGGSGCLGAEEAADRAPPPTWGSCDSGCIGLDEQSCIATPACRTTYDHACLLTDGPCPALTPFLGCYPVDTTGPIQGSCEGLDALQCSQHDDCLATYSELNGVRRFEVCLPELAPQCGDCG